MKKASSHPLPKASLLAALVFVGAVLPPHEAKALFIPPCEMTECPSTGPGAWAGVTSAGIASLTLLEQSIYVSILRLKDAIVRLANQSSNNRQNFIKGMASVNDHEANNLLASGLGAVRASIVPQILPSRTACGRAAVSTQMFQVSAFSTSQAVGIAETATTGILTNAPSTPGTQGQLSYVTARFQNRMTKYCNSANVAPPTGVTCTATIGVDRDLFPYDSIFKPANLSAANDFTAAKDVILNLMGEAVLDPVRGAALSRQEGQSLSVQRYSEQAKLNLSASILQSIVETRHDFSGTGGAGSERTQRDTSYNGMALQKMAEIGAGQTEGQNLDTLAVMMNDVNRDLLTLHIYLQNMAALTATGLAVNISEHSAGRSSVASRAVK